MLQFPTNHLEGVVMPQAGAVFSTETPRVFLAVPFSEDFKRRITTYQDALKARLKGMHWIAPANFHLTVKFFGETPLGKLSERILPKLEKLLAEAPEFELRFDGYGFFGSPRNPRVLYLHGEAPQLMATAEAVLKQFPDERPRPFHAHLTVAKALRKQAAADQRVNEELLRRWSEEGAESLGLPPVAASERITRLTLMESIFLGRAVRYDDRAEFRLG